MRIVKEPAERKQEILDAAIKVFYEKGYDKTSISDIAEKLGIAQGLCYRYFKSKEELFDNAIEYYAEQQVIEMRRFIEDSDKSIIETIKNAPTFMDIEKSVSNSDYYELFHSNNSDKIHNQLALKISEKMMPVVTKRLEEERLKGNIKIKDTKTMASFCVYGQLGILLDKKLTGQEKVDRIHKFILNIFE
ncbi:MAG: TetR/AcrR family transcriptional regulator [Clostridiaceae bacterium]|nr:TetR/AcrR family transcriptional regulator [Clostridiaceae bacterium]